MAIELKSIKCPECGANLSTEDKDTIVYCSYCGARIMISDENEHIYRYVDEAEIRRAETERIIKLKELDMVEKSSINKKTYIKIWLGVTIILFISSIFMFFIPEGVGIGLLLFSVAGGSAFFGGVLIFLVLPEIEADQLAMHKGGIRFPNNLQPFSGKNYEMVRNVLRNAGFTNITCVNMHDLAIGFFRKPGSIEKISVNGEDITSGGRVYMPNTPIIITYHGK